MELLAIKKEAARIKRENSWWYLFKSWMKALKEKTCPIINWTEETEK